MTEIKDLLRRSRAIYPTKKMRHDWVRAKQRTRMARPYLFCNLAAETPVFRSLREANIELDTEVNVPAPFLWLLARA